MCRVQWSVVTAVVVVVASFMQSGDALRCWKCSTAFDTNCKDYFNTTRLNQNRLQHESYFRNQNERNIIKEPYLEDCEAGYRPPNDQKYICLKTVETNPIPNGLPIVTRECRMVPLAFKEGKCPEEFEKKTNIEFCNTCPIDGCNSANGVQTNIILACSLSLILLP